MLSRLIITNLRNISHSEIELSPSLNLVIGQNGSGKTSLLEAVHYLATARSFRSSQISPLVRFGKSETVVFGVIRDDNGLETRVGVSRSLVGKREIRVNGESLSKSSDLARLLPVLVLGPDTVDLLLGPPQLRRKFLNWGVFHVKPDFVDQWDIANRCLKQRNRLLKNPYEKEELQVWTDRLTESAQIIDLQRNEYFEEFSILFLQLVEELTDFGTRVALEYYRGWDKELDLADIYRKNLANDQRRGFTHHGFQKADIRLLIEGRPAIEVCSRGELKMLAWAMVLTQGKMQSKQTGHNVLYLVDDLISELDSDHRRLLCRSLIKMEGQILSTGINQIELEVSWNYELANMFHVKQGVLSAFPGTLE